MDLGNYSQLAPGQDDEPEQPGSTATTPTSKTAKSATKTLSNKAGTGSSAEESSISKSRSSSVDSMDHVVDGEGVTAVMFAESFPSKDDFEISKCLYVGTSLGSVLVIVIIYPEEQDLR